MSLRVVVVVVVASCGVLGSRPAGPGETPDHWLILHIGKTAGSSFRTDVRKLAAEAGLSMQVHYPVNGKSVDGIPAFAVGHPADIIMGHLLAYGDSFHERLPENHTYKYATMFREPMQWMSSLYLFLNGGAREASAPMMTTRMMSWLELQLKDCPCLLREQTGPTECDSQFRNWVSPVDGRQCARGPLTCRDLAANWDAVPIVLLTERYVESLLLFRHLLGLKTDRGTRRPPIVTTKNDRSFQYAGAQIAFATALDYERFIENTCFRDIYVAVRQRFENDVRDIL